MTDGGVDIRFNILGMDNAFLTIEISNSTGVIRRYVDTSVTSGPYEAHWNCRDSQGYLVDEGTYTITVSVTSNDCKFIKAINRYERPDRKPGEFGYEASLFDLSGITVNSSGYLYVASGLGVHVFNPDGACVFLYKAIHGNICMDLDDRVFSPLGFNKIDKYGHVVRYPGGTEIPLIFSDAAINSTGYTFIVGSERLAFVRLYSPDLQYIRTIASKEIGPPGFHTVMGIAINSSDYVFIAEPDYHRISIFRPDGTYMSDISTSTYEPRFIAFDCFDNMYVTVHTPAALLIFSPEGWLTGEVHDLSPSSVGLFGIATSPDGRIYVSDISNDNIYVFYKGFFKQTHPVTIDRTRPEVAVIAPVAGETGFNINAPILAVFDEAMDQRSLNIGTFMLDGGAIGGEVAYDQATRTARFEPTVGLRPNSTYTVTLTTGICDAAGNYMAANNTWSFTTGAVATPAAYSSPTPVPAATTPVSTPAGAEWLFLTAIAIGGAGYMSQGRRRA